MGMSSMFCGSADAPPAAAADAGELLATAGEQAELGDQDLRGARERLLRRDGAVGLDLDRQLVVVGHLTDAGVLHVVVDLPDRREDRVHRDDADGQLLRPLRGQVADAALDREVHLDGHVIRVQRHQRLVRVDDLDVRGLHDVRGRHRAGSGLDQLELDRMRGVALEPQLLDVEDDLGDVLLDTRDAAELVVDVADLDRRDRRALEGRQQHAPQGVADRDAVAGRERAGLVLAVGLELLDGLDLGVLHLDHRRAYLE